MKRKLLTICLSSAIATSTLVGVTCSIAILTNKKNTKFISYLQNKIFDIENDTLKGFKKNASHTDLLQYCEGRILRLPDCKYIANGAFELSNLPSFVNDEPFYTKIVISNSTTSIGSRAFYGNTASSISWETEGSESSASSLLTTIGESAFAFCSNLALFQLPPKLFESGSSIAKSAFAGCTSLTLLDCSNYTVTSTFNTNGWAFGCFKGVSLTGNIKFNSTDETVPLNCSKLWSRFVYCGVEPAWNQVNSSSTAWSNQKKLVPDEYYIVTDGVLSKSRKIWFTDSVFNYAILPSTVSSIDITTSGTENIFKTKTNIKEWDLTNTTVTSLPASLLSDLSDTTISIKFNSSIQTIGDSTFKNCKWSLTIPTDSLTTIGANAFDGSSLTSWTFKTTMTSIGNNAFANCSSLTSLDFSDYSTAPTSGWGTTVFSNTGSSSTNNVSIKTSSNLVDQWRIRESMKPFLVTQGLGFETASSPKWTLNNDYDLTYEDLFDIQDGVLKGWAKDSSSNEMTETELNTVLGRLGVTTLTFPTSVTSIGDYAFYNTSTSKSTIPSSITAITFNGSNVTTIGKAAFKCLPSTITSLKWATTTNFKLQTIGEEAFYQLPASITTIDDFTKIKYLKTISKKAFYGMKCAMDDNCLYLVENENLTTIGDDAFAASTEFTYSLILPSSLTSIGNSAFYGCDFSVVEIPEFTNNISIGDMAFADNNHLSSIYLTGNSAAPENWSVEGNDMLSGIAQQGKIYYYNITTAGEYLAFLKQYSYEMQLGGWAEEQIT